MGYNNVNLMEILNIIMSAQTDVFMAYACNITAFSVREMADHNVNSLKLRNIVI